MLAIIGGLEFYAFKSLWITIKSKPTITRNIFLGVWWLSVLLQWGGLVAVAMNFDTLREDNPKLLMASSAFFFSLLIPKLFMAGFHAIDDIRYLIARIFSPGTSENGGNLISRSTFITTIGQVTGGLLFGSVLYGVTRGKYNYKVKNHLIQDPAIPEAWKGTKIVQFSDAHLGSFMENFEDVQKGIDIINSLEADYV
ncbi:MAG: hypothetical protein AAF193_05670, partial [Bacteroidota bacterium]